MLGLGLGWIEDWNKWLIQSCVNLISRYRFRLIHDFVTHSTADGENRMAIRNCLVGAIIDELTKQRNKGFPCRAGAEAIQDDSLQTSGGTPYHMKTMFNLWIPNDTPYNDCATQCAVVRSLKLSPKPTTGTSSPTS